MLHVNGPALDVLEPKRSTVSVAEGIRPEVAREKAVAESGRQRAVRAKAQPPSRRISAAGTSTIRPPSGTQAASPGAASRVQRYSGWPR